MNSINLYSTYSKGNYTPTEILQKNKTPFSITDTLSTESIAELTPLDKQDKIVIPGIEIPSNCDILGTNHVQTLILGYGITHDQKRFNDEIDEYNRRRIFYYEQYINSLIKQFNYLENIEFNCERKVSIQRLILDTLKGIITEEQLKEIKRYLIEKRCYNPQISTREAIRIIVNTGATPVLKLPMDHNLRMTEITLLLHHFEYYGVKGLISDKHNDKLLNYLCNHFKFANLNEPSSQEEFVNHLVLTNKVLK